MKKKLMVAIFGAAIALFGVVAEAAPATAAPHVAIESSPHALRNYWALVATWDGVGALASAACQAAGRNGENRGLWLEYFCRENLFTTDLLVLIKAPS